VKLIIYSLLGLLLAVASAALLSRDSGQIVLAFSDYAVQTSLGIFVFLLVAAFVVLYVLTRIFSAVVSLPETRRQRQQSRRHGKAEYHLTRGIVALTEGDWQSAEKAFKQGARFSSAPVVHYLGAAKAAQEQGAMDRRDDYLNLANNSPAGAELSIGIARAELQLEQQQTEIAFATLQKLNVENPGNSRIRSLLLEASAGLNDWKQMLELLNDCERRGGMPIYDIRAGQMQAWGEMLAAAACAPGVEELNKLWNSIPARLRKESYLLQVYVEGRLKQADAADCEPLLRDLIRESCDPGLVRLYGLVQGKDASKQLAFIEKLLLSHPTDAMVLLTAGRLYKRAALWGRAKHCLEESLRLSPGAEAHYELATMYQGQGDTANAGKYFREGLALAIATESDSTAPRALPPPAR
jgi:HemY protein